MHNFEIDEAEVKKIEMNKLLFSFGKKDKFEINEVLEILNVSTIPNEIKIDNNQIFIRNLSNYLVKHNLEPNINKK
jgi:hypothetical protein